jgi:hypothetical protein
VRGRVSAIWVRRVQEGWIFSPCKARAEYSIFGILDVVLVNQYANANGDDLLTRDMPMKSVTSLQSCRRQRIVDAEGSIR